MKEVMEQYGKAVITAFVASVLVFMLFSGIRIFHVLGERAQIPGTDYSGFRDGENTAIVMEQKPPLVWFLEKDIFVGEEYSPDDLFGTRDAKGNTAEIEILNILDKNGQEVDFAQGIKFLRQGSYRVLVKAADRDCCVSRQEFFIPVKRR